MTDFKKVYDYQNHVGSGQPSYYEMESKDRKSRKLSVNLAHELFEGMECWLGNNTVINPSENQVVDTGTMEDDTQQHAPQSKNEHATHFACSTHIGAEEDIPVEFEEEVDSSSLGNSTPKGLQDGKRGRPLEEASQ